MFEPAVAIAGDQRHEYIAVAAVQEGNRAGLGFEKGNLRLADATRVVGDALQVEVGNDPREDHFVVSAACLEAHHLWRAHFHREVDQSVVIGCEIHAETVPLGALRMAGGLRQGGVDRPVGGLLWGLQQKMAGEVFLAMHRQKDARAIEERMCFIDVGTAHGKVPGVDHVLHHQRPLAWSATPGMVAGLADFHRTALALGADGFDLTGEISNKIASGNPGRKGQHLPLRVGIQHGQRDAQPVSCEVMRHQRIEYGFVFHSAILTSKGDGMSAPMVKSEVRGRVALITLDRPKALNALSNELIDQLAELLRQYDADENIGAMVLMGSEKAFAAGADIAAM